LQFFHLREIDFAIDSSPRHSLTWHALLRTKAELLMPTKTAARRFVFRAIITDVHFWIPLSVLLGGLILLDKLH
jgi:hypothetical protein